MKCFVIAAASLVIASTSCQKDEVRIPDWATNGINTAVEQLKLGAALTEGTGRFPQSINVGKDLVELGIQLDRDTTTFSDAMKAQPAKEDIGKMVACGIYSWVSGFFPGSLWYAYELSGDEELKPLAISYTNLLAPVQDYTKSHDVGFMIGCSYGNALRLSQDDSIKTVIINTAESLITRFDPTIGCIRSWEFGDWNYPVIIDNMMNLELLFRASELSGDTKYRDIAITHANTTMENHFRPDWTSYHVVSYNDDGTVECRQTHQGKSDDSAWARGQAWGLYGYTMCYRKTGNAQYLALARNIADMIMSNVLTDDAVPLWDYSAPDLQRTPRDASAGAITSSAMLELSTMVDPDQSGKYFAYGERILESLSSPRYLAKPGENMGFVLKHSVGDLPHGNQIDTPLNYADYYYLEALKRYIDILRTRQ